MEYQLDKKRSSISWTAYQPESRIEGKVDFKQGKIKVNGEHITGGYVQADLKNLIVTDRRLARDQQETLENHLKSVDFFNVNEHPSAVFEVLEVRPSSGLTTHLVAGDLTIKGIKHKFEIPANIIIDKHKVDVKAKLSIIRTKFNVDFMIEESYGAKKILPEFDLEVHIVAIA